MSELLQPRRIATSVNGTAAASKAKLATSAATATTDDGKHIYMDNESANNRAATGSTAATVSAAANHRLDFTAIELSKAGCK